MLSTAQARSCHYCSLPLFHPPALSPSPRLYKVASSTPGSFLLLLRLASRQPFTLSLPIPQTIPFINKIILRRFHTKRKKFKKEHLLIKKTPSTTERPKPRVRIVRIIHYKPSFIEAPRFLFGFVLIFEYRDEVRNRCCHWHKSAPSSRTMRRNL